MQIRAQLVSAASTAPPCSLSSPGAMTSSAMSSSENPSGLPQDRHTEFSKARCWPQFGQVKSRMQHSPLERRHIDRDVDHAALGVRVDDAAQRRDVRVVAAPTRRRCSARRPSGRWSDPTPATGSAASTPTPRRAWRRCRSCVPSPVAGRSPGSPTRNWRPGRWRAGRRWPAGRSPGIPLPAPPEPRRPEWTPSSSRTDR